VSDQPPVPKKRPGFGPQPARGRLVKGGSPGATIRPCLTCGKPFPSEGPGNRMCKDCRNRADGVSPYEL